MAWSESRLLVNCRFVYCSTRWHEHKNKRRFGKEREGKRVGASNFKHRLCGRRDQSKAKAEIHGQPVTRPKSVYKPTSDKMRRELEDISTFASKRASLPKQRPVLGRPSDSSLTSGPPSYPSNASGVRFSETSSRLSTLPVERPMVRVVVDAPSTASNSPIERIRDPARLSTWQPRQSDLIRDAFQQGHSSHFSLTTDSSSGGIFARMPAAARDSRRVSTWSTVYAARAL